MGEKQAVALFNEEQLAEKVKAQIEEILEAKFGGVKQAQEETQEGTSATWAVYQGNTEVKQAQALAAISKFEVMDIPVGAAAGGGLIALAAKRLADMLLGKLFEIKKKEDETEEEFKARQKMMARVKGIVVNGLPAFIFVRFLRRPLGDLAKFAALFLTWEAFEAALPEIVEPVARIGVPKEKETEKEFLPSPNSNSNPGTLGGIEYYQKMLGKAS